MIAQKRIASLLIFASFALLRPNSSSASYVVVSDSAYQIQGLLQSTSSDSVISYNSINTSLAAPGLTATISGSGSSFNNYSIAGLTDAYTFSVSGANPANEPIDYSYGKVNTYSFGNLTVYPSSSTEGGDFGGHLYARLTGTFSGYVAPGDSVLIELSSSIGNGDLGGVFSAGFSQLISTPGNFSISYDSGYYDIGHDFEYYGSQGMSMTDGVYIYKGTGGGTSFVNVDPDLGVMDPSTVPEPSSVLLLCTGLGVVGCFRRKRLIR